MLKILQKMILVACCWGMIGSSYATEVMTFGQGLKPGENGLPPPLEKPLYLSVCLFDILGKNGDIYSRAKDLTLLARRWNVFVDIQVFMDERITAENFKAGQCDAAGISTLRARQFNHFIGSLDAVGAVPSYAHMRTVLHTLLDPKIIPLSITEPYQIVGVMPIGALYVMVRDRQINSIEKAAGKKIAVLDWDKSQAKMVEKLGAQPVASDITNFAGKFNNGQVDIIAVPAIAFTGAIYNFPLAQITGSLVINRAKIREKLPDLDVKMMSLREVGVQFLDKVLDQMFAFIDKEEKSIPAKYWMELPKEDHAKYNQMMREARIMMTKDGKMTKRPMCRFDF